MDPIPAEKSLNEFNAPSLEPVLVQPELLRNMQDTISFTVSVRIPDTDAATAAKYGVFFIAPFPCTLVQAQETHAALGTNGSPVTLTIEKLTGTTVKGSGIAMNSTTFNLKATINTVQFMDITSGISTAVTAGMLDRTLSRGDRVALLVTGTPTDVNEVVVTLVFKTDLANLPI